MEIKKEDLEKHYQALTDDEILKIYKSGGLTDVASKVLVRELQRRRLTDKKIHHKKIAEIENEKSNQQMKTKKVVQLIEKECPYCKTKFTTQRKNKKFCGTACQRKYKGVKGSNAAYRATWTEDEIKRWLWLRAIEWGAFPAYLSQPVAPILFIFYPWYFVVLGVFGLGLIWCFVRYSFVSIRLAGAAVIPVVWLKWPAAIGSCIYLFIHHQPVAAVFALVWPLVAVFTSLPAKVGIIELAFAKKIGFVLPDAEL